LKADLEIAVRLDRLQSPRKHLLFGPSEIHVDPREFVLIWNACARNMIVRIGSLRAIRRIEWGGRIETPRNNSRAPLLLSCSHLARRRIARLLRGVLSCQTEAPGGPQARRPVSGAGMRLLRLRRNPAARASGPVTAGRRSRFSMGGWLCAICGLELPCCSRR
jgi:hypothetical protein